jgi:ATP-binding cassette subfamily B protein
MTKKNLNRIKEQAIGYQLKSFGRLWPYLWPHSKPSYKIRTLFAITATIAGQFIIVAAPFFLGKASDNIEVQITELGLGAVIGSSILILILAYGGLRLASIMLSEGREYIFAPVAQHAQRSIATLTFGHLHKLSLRYHLEKRTGGISRVIERGIRSIDFLFRFLLFNIGPTLLQLTLAGIAFWVAYSWEFALIAVGVVVAYIWFTVVTTEWRLRFRRDMNTKDTEANSKAIDSLLNYETVKYFNAEQYETRRYDKAMKGYQKAAILSRTSLATVNIGQSFLMNIGLIGLVLLATQRALTGEMTTGDILTITLVMMQVYRPLNILGFAYREIKQALTDMEKMFALLDLQPEIQDCPDAIKLNGDQADINFSGVCFRYESERSILKDVSFTIKRGDTVAVVGPTGAGKSTLSRILFRFYDIEAGSVHINGHDITKISLESLRKFIGIVPQDTVLFNDTIGYNIGYANPAASQEDIEKVAKNAQIHDFIKSLPNGYKTLVGERGLKLSGGEKQRVAIARTLLKNPAILILDEATSALDSVTEEGIQSALEAVSANRTTLVIAHRLSTIVNADKIIVMDKGKIVEQGKHTQLLKKNRLYKELWEQQKSKN